jgi:hypothetical protein|nr:MAG TPA: major capsid protein [Caudoviricetes sp.]
MSLVIGSVYADAVNSKLGTALKMKDIATDYTDMVSDILVYGNEVHFPTFNRLSDAEEVTKGTALVPEEVGMSDSTAKVKQTGKSVRIYDKDKAQIKGAVVDAMASQTAEVMAKKIDSDLILEMVDNAVYKTALPGELTVTAIDSAFDVFGDQVQNSSFSGIVAHGKFRSAIMRMDEFTKIDKTYATTGNGIVDDNNCIGFWNGTIPVYLSDQMWDATNSEPIMAVVKTGAIGYIMQKETTVEEEREAKLLATDLVASNLYACKLLDTKGVSILKKTIA